MELTRQVVAGYLSDLNGVWLAEDIVFHGPSGRQMRGRGKAAAWLGRDTGVQLRNPHLHLDHLLIDGSNAAAECHLTGTEEETGGDVTVPMVGMFEVNDGEIVRLRLYRDAPIRAHMNGPAAASAGHEDRTAGGTQ